MCHICGQPTCFSPDSCISAQPFCDNCAEETRCIQKIDDQCAIYHFNSNEPSLLTNLGFQNGANLEDILEKIDLLIGTQFNVAFSGVDTITIKWTPGGTYGHSPKADVNISSQSGNTLVTKFDGLFVPNTNDGKVKISSSDIADYLENQIVGGTDGCINISVVPTTGNTQILQVLPSMDIQCLANAFCSEENTIARSTLGVCLFNSMFAIQDTQSINLTLIPGVPFILSADAKISSASGNTLVINSDGLYATGGIASANNGLSLSGSTVQLGGTLIKDTTIDFGTSFQLNMINHPRLSVGVSTPTSLYFTVEGSDDNVPTLSNVSSQQTVRQTSVNTFNCFLKMVGGPFVLNGTEFWVSNTGQLLLDNSGGAITLDSDVSIPYTGIYGTVIKSSANNVTGNVISGGYFGGFPADSGNISDMGAVRIAGPNNPPLAFGANYSGTITNYYGILIEDIAGAHHGGSVTNKFAIYQKGTSDISRFFGPVQNASSSVQFTSDIRVKENITPFTRGLTEIDQIDTKKFNYIYNKQLDVTGIIAQELESIIPEAVKKGNFQVPDGENYTDFRMVDQTTIFYTMLNAIKELSSLNKSLTERVKLLEQK